MGKLADNLKELMRLHKLNPSELSRKTGISQPVLHRIISDTTTNPNVGTLSPIASYFSVSINQLIGELNLPSPEVDTYIPIGNHVRQVPLISWSEATTWQGAKNKTKRHKLITTAKGVTGSAFALLIEDDIDSRFPEGTLLIIEPKRIPRNRDYVIVQQDKHSISVIRRYILDGENVFLKPIDPHLETVKFMEEKYRIIGVVVQSLFDFD